VKHKVFKHFNKNHNGEKMGDEKFAPRPTEAKTTTSQTSEIVEKLEEVSKTLKEINENLERIKEVDKAILLLLADTMKGGGYKARILNNVGLRLPEV
jgi:transcription termination factor NusB